MFWWVVTPFLITLGLVPFAVVGGTFVLPRTAFWRRRNWRWGWTFVLLTGAGFVVFIPTCSVVSIVISPLRFGTFAYDKAEDVWGSRARRFFPPGAQQITLHTRIGGNAAVYRVDRAALERHLESLWADAPSDVLEHREVGEVRPVDLARLELSLPAGHPARGLLNAGPVELRVYNGPFAANGAGCMYYADPVSDWVFHRAGYW